MTKIHLRANKLTETNRAKPFCATRVINGKVYDNSRDTYRFMNSEIVGFKAFREVTSENRCSHCVDIGLAQRNKVRKERGFSQVTKIEAAWIEHE